ncbi:MAG TPA: hypothetical protein VGD78_03125 [Chthoniobacterales bacterium]
MSTPPDPQDARMVYLREKGLYLFGGNEAAFQKWLLKPDPQLGGSQPQQVIDQGQPETVIALIESALRGIPD